MQARVVELLRRLSATDPATGRPIQIVVRRRPRLTIYWRIMPTHVINPSRGVLEARLRFAEIAWIARELSDEQVAELVGGKVFKKNLILMPDGRILPKTAALVAVLMKGYRSEHHRPRRSHVLENLTRLVEVVG